MNEDGLPECLSVVVAGSEPPATARTVLPDQV